MPAGDDDDVLEDESLLDNLNDSNQYK